MVQPQQRLAQLLRSVSGAVKDSLDSIVLQQKRLIKGLEEYLGLDLTGVDAAAMTLVVECSGAVEQCERLLRETGLAELPRACDEVELECEELLQLREKRDEALKAQRHYEEKLVGLTRASQGKGRQGLQSLDAI